jgi:hypothetical protein
MSKTKKLKFEGFPYQNYTVGITQAGRAAIEVDLDRYLVGADGEKCTAAEAVLELATKCYRQSGMPPFMSAAFPVTLHSGVPLTVFIDQQDRLLACWVASEAHDGKVPAVHIDDRHCSADFIDRYSPHTLH